jgi:hypothetical protein
MSQATVYSGAQYGMADQATATGMYASSVSFTASSSMAEAPDSIGCLVGVAVYDPRCEVSVEGIVKTKTSNIPSQIGEVITIAAATENSRARTKELIDAASNSVVIITGGSVNPTNTGFETGNITGIFYPYLSTTSPTTLTVA